MRAVQIPSNADKPSPIRFLKHSGIVLVRALARTGRQSLFLGELFLRFCDEMSTAASTPIAASE
jgi:hypothetical protein